MVPVLPAFLAALCAMMPVLVSLVRLATPFLCVILVLADTMNHQLVHHWFALSVPKQTLIVWCAPLLLNAHLAQSDTLYRPVLPVRQDTLGVVVLFAIVDISGMVLFAVHVALPLVLTAALAIPVQFAANAMLATSFPLTAQLVRPGTTMQQ